MKSEARSEIVVLDRAKAVYLRLAIGDALAAVWMERSGVSPEDFALNHPAGSLGKQLTLTAADLMVPVERLARCRHWRGPACAGCGLHGA